MREAEQEARTGLDQERLKRTGADLDKRFPVALGLYAVLAVLVWFTMDAGKIMVMGRPVDIRLVPIVIIAGLALRTVLARSAEKIRRSGNGESGTTPRSL